MTRLIAIFTIGLFACSSAVDRQNKTIKKSALSDTITPTDKQTVKLDCIRGAAKPIIKKKVYPHATFILQPDSITGIETLAIDNGDKLTIKNWGSEYYILTFNFVTSRFQQDTTNLDFWFKSAGALMTEILDGLDAPIDLQKGINKLLGRDGYSQNLKLGEKFDFGGDDIRSFVTLDRIERLPNNKFTVDISFATGPL